MKKHLVGRAEGALAQSERIWGNRKVYGSTKESSNTMFQRKKIVVCQKSVVCFHERRVSVARPNQDHSGC